MNTQNKLIHEIISVIDEKIKNNKKGFGKSKYYKDEVCFICYENSNCKHKFIIQELEEVKNSVILKINTFPNMIRLSEEV